MLADILWMTWFASISMLLQHFAGKIDDGWRPRGLFRGGPQLHPAAGRIQPPAKPLCERRQPARRRQRAEYSGHIARLAMSWPDQIYGRQQHAKRSNPE